MSAIMQNLILDLERKRIFCCCSWGGVFFSNKKCVYKKLFRSCDILYSFYINSTYSRNLSKPALLAEYTLNVLSVKATSFESFPIYLRD